MKLTQIQLESIAQKVLDHWKQNNLIQFKTEEKKVFARMVESIRADYQKELDLEKLVNKMLDDLEQSNAGEFQRYKMYPMLKQKLAKERKVIL